MDSALDRLQQGSLSMLALPTPAEGPPEDDRELAFHAASAVRRMLERKAIAVTEEGRRPLLPEDIGMVATHRVVNARLVEELGPLADQVRVDTPERWQGLERAVMVAVHPLSSVVSPGEFDLDTGRLCVMTSRHRVGLLLITRDHIATTLEQHVPPRNSTARLPRSGRPGPRPPPAALGALPRARVPKQLTMSHILLTKSEYQIDKMSRTS